MSMFPVSLIFSGYTMPVGPSSPRVTPNHRRHTGTAAIKRAAKKALAKRKANQLGAA